MKTKPNTMFTKSKSLTRLFIFQKYVGILCILIAIPILLLDMHKDMTLLLGLFLLFTAPGKQEDERSLSLKTSSLYISFILTYAFKMLSSNLITEVNHFMILVFSLSLIIYYIRFYSFR